MPRAPGAGRARSRCTAGSRSSLPAPPAFERYEVVGWGVGRGSPAVRRNMRPIDGYWAGDPPRLVLDRRGPAGRGADRAHRGGDRRPSLSPPVPRLARPQLQHFRRLDRAQRAGARPRHAGARGRQGLSRQRQPDRPHAERQRLPALAARGARARDRPRRGPRAQPAGPGDRHRSLGTRAQAAGHRSPRPRPERRSAWPRPSRPREPAGEPRPFVSADPGRGV